MVPTVLFINTTLLFDRIAVEIAIDGICFDALSFFTQLMPKCFSLFFFFFFGLQKVCSNDNQPTKMSFLIR